MSSNNNSEVNGMIFVMALMGAAAIFMALVLYIILGVAALALSVLCLFALRKPLKIGKETITPHEAKWFLMRGIIGWWVGPLFIAVLATLFHWRIPSDWTIHFMIGGYIIGSLGVEFILAKLREEEEAQARLIAPTAPNGGCDGSCSFPGGARLQGSPFAEPEKPEFKFAEWSDEESLS